MRVHFLGGKIPWRKEWQPIPLFLPGEYHGQRSLEAYSPWGRKESDMTEVTNTFTFNLYLSLGGIVDKSFV